MKHPEEIQIKEVKIPQHQKYYLLLSRYEDCLFWDGSQTISTVYDDVFKSFQSRKQYDEKYNHKTEYKIVSFTLPL